MNHCIKLCKQLFLLATGSAWLCFAQTQATPHFFQTYAEFKAFFLSKDMSNKELFFGEFMTYLDQISDYQNRPEFATTLTAQQKSDNIKLYTNWWSHFTVDLLKDDRFDIQDVVHSYFKNLNIRAESLRQAGNSTDAAIAYQHALTLSQGTYLEYNAHTSLANLHFENNNNFDGMTELLAAKAALAPYKSNPINELVVRYTDILSRIAVRSLRAGRSLNETKLSYEEYFDHGIDHDSHDVNIKELAYMLKQYKSLLKELKITDQTYINKVNNYLLYLQQNPTETTNDLRIITRRRNYNTCSPETMALYESQIGDLQELKSAFYTNILNSIESND